MLRHVVSGNDQPYSIPQTAHQTYIDNTLGSDNISAQLGYTVPFTLVHAGKYSTEDELKIQTI